MYYFIMHHSEFVTTYSSPSAEEQIHLKHESKVHSGGNCFADSLSSNKLETFIK